MFEIKRQEGESLKKLHQYRIFKGACLVLFALLFTVNTCVHAKNNVNFSEGYVIEENRFLNYVLSVSDNSQIAGLTVTIQYDEEQLRLVENSVGDILQSSINKVNSKIDKKVILTAISTEPITQGGSLLDLKFEIVDSSKEYVDIKYTIDECIDQNCENIAVSINTEKMKNPLYQIVEEEPGEQQDTQEMVNNISNKAEEIEGNGHNKTETELSSEEFQQEDNNAAGSSYEEKPSGVLLSEENKDDQVRYKEIWLIIVIAIVGLVVTFFSIFIIRRKQK